MDYSKKNQQTDYPTKLEHQNDYYIKHKKSHFYELLDMKKLIARSRDNDRFKFYLRLTDNHLNLNSGLKTNQSEWMVYTDHTIDNNHPITCDLYCTCSHNNNWLFTKDQINDLLYLKNIAKASNETVKEFLDSLLIEQTEEEAWRKL